MVAAIFVSFFRAMVCSPQSTFPLQRFARRNFLFNDLVATIRVAPAMIFSPQWVAGRNWKLFFLGGESAPPPQVDLGMPIVLEGKFELSNVDDGGGNADIYDDDYVLFLI